MKNSITLILVISSYFYSCKKSDNSSTPVEPVNIGISMPVFAAGIKDFEAKLQVTALQDNVSIFDTTYNETYTIDSLVNISLSGNDYRRMRLAPKQTFYFKGDANKRLVLRIKYLSGFSNPVRSIDDNLDFTSNIFIDKKSNTVSWLDLNEINTNMSNPYYEKQTLLK